MLLRCTLRRIKRVDLDSTESKDCNSSGCANKAGLMHSYVSKYILYKTLYFIGSQRSSSSTLVTWSYYHVSYLLLRVNRIKLHNCYAVFALVPILFLQMLLIQEVIITTGRCAFRIYQKNCPHYVPKLLVFAVWVPRFRANLTKIGICHILSSFKLKCKATATDKVLE